MGALGALKFIGQDDEVEPVRWTAEHEAELPPGGVFDVDELSRWDGVQLPMCMEVGFTGIDVGAICFYQTSKSECFTN